jgi:hypothetical protein
MKMPGAPAPMGAEGQINVPGAIIEAAEPHDAPPEDGDDRVDVPVGQQEHGPNSPTHGTAGGLDVTFTDVAPDLFTPASTSTGMTTGHPAFGRAVAADRGQK